MWASANCKSGRPRHEHHASVTAKRSSACNPLHTVLFRTREEHSCYKWKYCKRRRIVNSGRRQQKKSRPGSSGALQAVIPYSIEKLKPCVNRKISWCTVAPGRSRCIHNVEFRCTTQFLDVTCIMSVHFPNYLLYSTAAGERANHYPVLTNSAA